MLNCKRGEIGETMTWVVATVIIVVLLIIFVYASNALGFFQIYKVSSGERTLDSEKYLEIKTGLALKENSSNENKINEWIASIDSSVDETIDTQFVVAG